MSLLSSFSNESQRCAVYLVVRLLTYLSVWCCSGDFGVRIRKCISYFSVCFCLYKVCTSRFSYRSRAVLSLSQSLCLFSWSLASFRHCLSLSSSCFSSITALSLYPFLLSFSVSFLVRPSFCSCLSVPLSLSLSVYLYMCVLFCLLIAASACQSLLAPSPSVSWLLSMSSVR